MKQRILTVFFLMIFISLACSRTVILIRSVPTLSDNVDFEFEEIPDLVKQGEIGKFQVKTTPGNRCYAQIEYWDTDGVFRGLLLPDQIADDDGMCSYEWKLEEEFDIRAGFARFLISIYEENDSANPSPQIFCVINCP